MNKLLSISDKDIFPNFQDSGNTLPDFRLAVKIILFDNEEKLALLGTKYRLLPGGGVEEGESLEEAVSREVLEEVGCRTEIEKEFAVTEEFRAKMNRRQETHFFLAKVVGEKGIPQTKQEDEQGIEIEWYKLEDAIGLLEKELKEIPFESYNSCFNVRTHLAVLKELQKSGTTRPQFLI